MVGDTVMRDSPVFYVPMAMTICVAVATAETLGVKLKARPYHSPFRGDLSDKSTQKREEERAAAAAEGEPSETTAGAAAEGNGHRIRHRTLYTMAKWPKPTLM
jgi:hypothetical protein